MRPEFPERDRIPYPDGTALVTCAIGARGSLSQCTSSLTDERGAWLSGYVNRWRVLSNRVDGCAVRGRTFAIKFHLKAVGY